MKWVIGVLILFVGVMLTLAYLGIKAPRRTFVDAIKNNNFCIDKVNREIPESNDVEKMHAYSACEEKQ